MGEKAYRNERNGFEKFMEFTIFVGIQFRNGFFFFERAKLIRIVPHPNQFIVVQNIYFLGSLNDDTRDPRMKMATSSLTQQYLYIRIYL